MGSCAYANALYEQGELIISTLQFTNNYDILDKNFI